MAAEHLAAAGGSVRLFERTPSVGRKLLLAGRSGLNLTHSEPTDELLARYGAATGRLSEAIRRFDADALREWARGLGETTFVGSSGRVFPEAMRANGLLKAWIARLDSLGVEIVVGHRWIGWGDDGVLRFETSDGDVVEAGADIVVLALGGASWPSVGSDGRWVEAVSEAGIAVAPLRAANSGFEVAWTPQFLNKHEGEPIKNVAVTCGDVSSRGEAVITESGVEGGVIYAVGAVLRDVAEANGSATAMMNLHPDLSRERLIERLARRRAKDTLSTTLKRSGLEPVKAALVNEVLRAPGQLGGRDAPGASDVEALADLVMALPLRVLGPTPIDRAISTAGGISFDELDERFMIRRFPGTFAVGEMLDWEAPTGGYLLQATFATAVAAANGALDWLSER